MTRVRALRVTAHHIIHTCEVEDSHPRNGHSRGQTTQPQALEELVEHVCRQEAEAG